jgi:hypothetical protein
MIALESKSGANSTANRYFDPPLKIPSEIEKRLRRKGRRTDRMGNTPYASPLGCLMLGKVRVLRTGTAFHSAAALSLHFPLADKQAQKFDILRGGNVPLSYAANMLDREPYISKSEIENGKNARAETAIDCVPQLF